MLRFVSFRKSKIDTTSAAPAYITDGADQGPKAAFVKAAYDYAEQANERPTAAMPISANMHHMIDYRLKT